jgi:hypothetical protein
MKLEAHVKIPSVASFFVMSADLKVRPSLSFLGDEDSTQTA